MDFTFILSFNLQGSLQDNSYYYLHFTDEEKRGSELRGGRVGI